MNKLLNLTLLLVAINCLTFSDHQAKKLTNKLTLKFDYAPREGKPFETSAFIVYWNSKKIASITPKDNYVQEATY